MLPSLLPTVGRAISTPNGRAGTPAGKGIAMGVSKSTPAVASLAALNATRAPACKAASDLKASSSLPVLPAMTAHFTDLKGVLANVAAETQAKHCILQHLQASEPPLKESTIRRGAHATRATLEDRLAEIRRNSKGRSINERFNEVKSQVAQNKAYIDEHRKHLAVAQERRQEKEKIEAEERLIKRKASREAASRRPKGEATWLSYNAEREDIDAVFETTRWSEVFKETAGNAWAMTTWHAQPPHIRDRPCSDVIKTPEMTMTMRLSSKEDAMRCNPFF